MNENGGKPKTVTFDTIDEAVTALRNNELELGDTIKATAIIGGKPVECTGTVVDAICPELEVEQSNTKRHVAFVNSSMFSLQEEHRDVGSPAPDSSLLENSVRRLGIRTDPLMLPSTKSLFPFLPLNRKGDK